MKFDIPNPIPVIDSMMVYASRFRLFLAKKEFPEQTRFLLKDIEDPDNTLTVFVNGITIMVSSTKTPHTMVIDYTTLMDYDVKVSHDLFLSSVFGVNHEFDLSTMRRFFHRFISEPLCYPTDIFSPKFHAYRVAPTTHLSDKPGQTLKWLGFEGKYVEDEYVLVFQDSQDQEVSVPSSKFKLFLREYIKQHVEVANDNDEKYFIDLVSRGVCKYFDLK